MNASPTTDVATRMTDEEYMPVIKFCAAMLVLVSLILTLM